MEIHMENSKPSFLRVIQSDYLALLGLLFPAVFFVMYIAVAYFGYFPGLRGRDPIQGTEGAPIFLYGFIIGAIIGIPLSLWRYKRIQTIFLNGITLVGKIEGVFWYRDRGSIDISYQYEGKSFLKPNPIMKNARTRAFTKGMDVAVVVNKDDPNQAVIRDLYI